MKSLLGMLALLLIAVMPAFGEPPGHVAKSIQPPGGIFKHDLAVTEVLPLPSEDDAGTPAGEVTLTIGIKNRRNAESTSTCADGTCSQVAYHKPTETAVQPVADTGQFVTNEQVRYTNRTGGGGGLFGRLRSSTCRSGSCQ